MGKQKPLIADISDEEDTSITVAAETDPDNPIWSDEDFRRAKPPSAHPELTALLNKDDEAIPLKARKELQLRERIEAQEKEFFELEEIFSDPSKEVSDEQWSRLDKLGRVVTGNKLAEELGSLEVGDGITISYYSYFRFFRFPYTIISNSNNRIVAQGDTSNLERDPWGKVVILNRRISRDNGYLSVNWRLSGLRPYRYTIYIGRSYDVGDD